MHSRINRERVKVLRLGKAWTQQNLADRARISLRSVQRIEREGVAALQSRASIAEAFGIEPDELELDNNLPNSRLSNIITLVIFSYVSFYIGLELFDIDIGAVPVWAVPLIPSLTILIFGPLLGSQLPLLK